MNFPSITLKIGDSPELLVEVQWYTKYDEPKVIVYLTEIESGITSDSIRFSLVDFSELEFSLEVINEAGGSQKGKAFELREASKKIKDFALISFKKSNS